MVAYWYCQINSFGEDNSVKTAGKHDGAISTDTPAGKPSPKLARAVLTIVFVLVGLEALLVVGAFAWLLVQLVTTHPVSLGGGIAIVVLAAIAAAWLIATAIGVLRARSWARGSAITWQVLQLALAIGCFQGLYAEPSVGWPLLIPALVAGFLALSKPMTEALGRREVAEQGPAA